MNIELMNRREETEYVWKVVKETEFVNDKMREQMNKLKKCYIDTLVN
jgi:hypothetical protein